MGRIDERMADQIRAARSAGEPVPDIAKRLGIHPRSAWRVLSGEWKPPKPRTPIKQRFLKKRRIAASGCHEWTGAKNPHGYGVIGTWDGEKTVVELAHRVAFKLFKGPIPVNRELRHECDNPACVNPDHLVLGTHQENMNDMIDRRRAAFGSVNGRSGSNHLTRSRVRTVRKLREAGWTLKELSERFHVSTTTIFKAIHRLRWKEA
jgi:hypothetical protein